MRRQLRACLIAVSLVVANMPTALATAFTFTTIDVPGVPTSATGINDTGQIVGTFFGGTHGYLLSGGTFTTIDVPGASFTSARGINGPGQIVGAFQDATGFHGYLLSGGTFTTIDVPGASSTEANGINDTGQIIGTYSDAAGTHGYLLSGGTFTTIDVPGAPTSATGRSTRQARSWGPSGKSSPSSRRTSTAILRMSSLRSRSQRTAQVLGRPTR
jgi:uncharacterized membrane protein